MIAVSNRLRFRVNRKDMTYRTRLDHQYLDNKKGGWDKIYFCLSPPFVRLHFDVVAHLGFGAAHGVLDDVDGIFLSLRRCQ